MICPKGWCLEERLGLSASDAQILYVVAAIVLVGITGYYAWQNKRMADHNATMVAEIRRQSRILQYERRAAILRGCLRCFGLVFRDGHVGGEVIPCWLEATSEKEYLLDADLCGYLDEIYKRCVHAYTLRLQWKELPQGDERTRLVHEESEVIKYLTEQPVEIRQRFREYLQVED